MREWLCPGTADPGPPSVPNAISIGAAKRVHCLCAIRRLCRGRFNKIDDFECADRGPSQDKPRRAGQQPIAKQAAFAENLIRIKRRAEPDECLCDKGLMSMWIGGNAGTVSWLQHFATLSKRPEIRRGSAEVFVPPKSLVSLGCGIRNRIDHISPVD